MNEMIKNQDNSFGVLGVVFGILSIVFFALPIIGLVLGIIGVVFAYKQNKYGKNSWSKSALWLCWIGIIVGVLWDTYYIKNMIEIVSQYQGNTNALQGASGSGGVDLNAYSAAN
jgi:uncharacterized membrane protein